MDRLPAEVPVRAVTVKVTSPAPRDAWRDILESSAAGLVTQTPDWLDSICAVDGCEDASRLYETSDGRQLVLPVVRRRLPGRLSTQASLPSNWGIGGLVGRDAVRPQDVATVTADLAGLPDLRTSIRPNPLDGPAWAAGCLSSAIAAPRTAHVLDLEGGFDTVWSKRFAALTRTGVRKAERSGLIVECDTTGRLVPVFYRLFSLSVARWARQQHEPLFLAAWRARRRDPVEKFQHLARALGDAFRIWVAWRDGKPAATILVLQGANAHYTRGAMDKELAGPVSANDLLHKLAIEEACRAGCRYYHMGETGTSASLARFKARFGARPYPYAEYRLERLPITKADNLVRGFGKRLIRFKDS